MSLNRPQQYIIIFTWKYVEPSRPIRQNRGCLRRQNFIYIWYDIFNCNWVATRWQ